MFSIAAFVLVSTLAASAADINVQVGPNQQLVFNPTSVQAQPGDSIHFEFEALNHSVTQSTFDAPCNKKPDGIDSGFMFISQNATAHPVWTFNVTDTTPLWFYCAQTNPALHCAQKGMVFAVNPTADKSFSTFQQNAMNGTAAASAAGGNSTGSGVTSAPTGAGAGSAGSAATAASGAGVVPSPSGSGFVTAVSQSSSTGSAGAATTGSPNDAVGLSSAGAVSFVSLFAAVAGFML